jgi:D-alanyl-D-alanine carboxypeptidase
VRAAAGGRPGRRWPALLAALALLLAAACDGPLQPPPSAALHLALDSLLAAEGPAAGLGVSAAVVGGGFEAWAGVHGTRTTVGLPVQAGTVFQVASVTKQFTAAAVMLLVEEGRLSLDDEVGARIPALAWQGPVRVHHLLEHTSGLPEYTERFADPWQPVTLAAILDTIAARPLEFAPGERFAYSNSGYFVLGLLIEAVSGVEYADFLRQRLLEPAGLHATSYCGRPPNVAVPQGYVMLGQLLAVPPIRMELAYAAGGLCSTASDLARWARALARGQVVSAASYARMTTPARLNGGQSVPYGLGLILVPRAGRAYHSHAGAIPGFQSQLAYYPADDVAVAVLINQMPTDPVALEQRLADLTFARSP